MVDIIKNGPKPIVPLVNNVTVSSGSVTKRATSNLLPGVNRTETMVKFFNATVDHMFQPEDVEFISGYIGSKPAYYDSAKDYYITEITKDRRDYQLPVTALSVDASSNATSNVMFYDDLLNQLKLQGALTSDPSRLLDGEYYSWSPPIDVDKFINFNEYYWLPDGPTALILTSRTDLVNDAMGKENFTYFGSYVRQFDNVALTGEIQFTSGMRIVVTDDISYHLNGKTLIIDGVGRSIIIEEDTIFKNPSWDTVGWDRRGWDGGDSAVIPDFMTIGRLSTDRNRWSVNNRWFHKDVIAAAGMNIMDQQQSRALRPIIEFESNTRLYNFGTHGRVEVDLMDSVNTNIFAAVAGKPAASIDGTELLEGMRILVTADRDANVNNRIYEVSGISQYGEITLNLVKDGRNPNGAPVYGDTTYVIFGSTHADKSFWYNGSAWVQGQEKIKYAAPLFAGYDKDGINLQDPAVYPGSTFAGTEIFTYAIDETAPIDQFLNIRAKRDQFGDYVFNNCLATDAYSFVENNQTKAITGYLWYMVGDEISNSWYKARNNTKQYLLNTFDIASPTSTFMIDQRPDQDIAGQLPNLRVYLIRGGAARLLVEDADFTIEGRIVTLTTPAVTGDRIEIYSWSSTVANSSNGMYVLPPTLISNPNNTQPAMVSFNDTIPHFSQIIANQAGETTNGIGDTNWRDGPQVRGLGTSILQHRSPLLKLMMLNSNDINIGILGNNSPTDPSLAIQFAQREYNRFYNRFIRALFNLYANMGYSKGNPPQEWVDAALKQVNLGKSRANPWAYSGYEINEDFSNITAKPTFVPATAARLGVAPVFKPEAFLDDSYYPPKLTLQTHDGARIIMEDLSGLALGTIEQGLKKTSNPTLLTDPVAGAWLAFELNIYNSIPMAYKSVDATPAFDRRTQVPGKWRTSSYSRTDIVNLMRPSFDKWIIQSQVDYRANTTFEINNQFSFNYSLSVDKDGQPVPGNWRGIYRWFYDTDRPHSHPWEMLGFSQQPDWWTAEYGPAPYTAGNTHLWEDLRDGVIRQGARAGTDAKWTRPGLMSCIPVDNQGALLPPLLAGTVVSLPSLPDAQAEWQFGDCGPIESVWLTGLENGFVSALTSYLMKPAQFIEQGWDPLRTTTAGQGDSEQSLYLDTDSRRSSNQFYVHREDPQEVTGAATVPNESSLSFFGSWGVQHWFSEYLISQNLSVSKYLGNIIRGATVNLGHKFGGFVGTDNSLRVMADSFGQIGYTSQLIPSENIHTYLYRSTSLGTHFYSGVIVIKQRNGWKVIGYDGINPVFTIIPSVKNGPKTNLVIGNQSVTDYQMGQGLEQVQYGTVFGTSQEVYDFLVSYGRWLESEGWIFDEVNQDNTSVINWRQSGRDFMYWSQGNWANGNFVALSPLANGAKFKAKFGTIQYVNGTIGGTYPVLDKSGQAIEKQNIEVLRQDGEIKVKTINPQTIFGLRLFTTTVEHIMLLDNVTQFNDLIYDPLYTLFQPRLKVYGYRTNNWDGRLDAPGYFLYQDPTTAQWNMISNFEKTAEDFRNLYNIDEPKNALVIDNKTGETHNVSNSEHVVTRNDLANLAKHTIGYQKRDYLQNLLLDETTEFQFYQGFIRQKGTKRAIESMLRNNSIINDGENINYYEEFALRKGRYGAVSLNANIDFILSQSDFGNSPQRIDVFSHYNSDQTRSGAIEIVARDPRIVVPPENYEGKLFPLRHTNGTNLYEDLPTAGYVQLGETTHQVLDRTELLGLSYNLIAQDSTVKVGDTIWQLITPDLSWNVWKVVSPTAVCIGTTNSQNVGTPTAINFDGPHGIVNGDIIVCSNFANNDAMNGTFIAQDVTTTSVTIPVNTFIDETSGTVKVYRSIRYYSKSDLDYNAILGGWQEGDRAYVDNGIANGTWTVYQWHFGKWEAERSAEPRVNANLMLESKLYSKKTLSVTAYLEYFDPVKGQVPGIADREISYKNVFDPAKYNSGDDTVYSLDSDRAWTDSHVGEVWWDLSTTRYVDYEQGDLDYRIRNWGKIAPGTTIDIYEWVRSPIPPTSWAAYAAGNNPLTQYGVSYIPSGTVRNPDSPAWTETVEYDKNGNKKTWYYFWVGHSDMKPTVPGRSLTTKEITTVVTNPDSNDIAWYAAIGERSLILSNVYRYLDGDNTVMQIIYTDKPNNENDHKEWTLVRHGDQYSQIDDEYWSKMRDSLTGFDLMGNTVPDPHLNELQRYGNLIRPRQTWFKDRLQALSIWVSKVNSQLADAETPLAFDPDKYNWLEWFGQGEPQPPREGNWDYHVSDTVGLMDLVPTARDGDRVLMDATAGNNNLWTIWTFDIRQGEFYKTRIQSYNVPNYWIYVDWYYTGYSSTNIVTYTVADLVALEKLTLSSGQIAKVLNNGDGRWAWYALVNGERRLVAMQDGTIEITDNLWNSDINLDGWDKLSYDSIPFDYNPTVEIGLIFDGVRYGLYGTGSSIEMNELFFSMINYVLSEQKFVDWIFKTSYMLISGSNEALSTSQLYKPSTVDSLLDYVNEAKPYRNKIREFISGRSTSDNVVVSASDFDGAQYSQDLIRKLKTKLVFDRVSSLPEAAKIVNADSFGSTVRFTVSPEGIADSFRPGEPVIVRDVIPSGDGVPAFGSSNVIVMQSSGNVIVASYGGNIGLGSGVGGAVFHHSFGAAGRILRDYHPTQYMAPLDSPDLISGTDYRGRIYTGTDFNLDPGWGVAPWDFSAGWDADAMAFDQYLEIIMQGGMPPEYDQFYGTGERTQFKLKRIPQDLLHTKVWRDNVLAVYGVDYTVPNWAVKIEIAQPGKNYAVGDLLTLIEDQPTQGSRNVDVRVTQVDGAGGIRKVEILNRGFYSIVQHNPFRVKYDGYHPGSGTDALLQPVWGGDTLVFTDPPNNSDKPNIWILYAGTTFIPAPDGENDVITDGDGFVQPYVAQDHAEELYTTRLRDAIRVDTYTQPVGGRPLVVFKNYVADGLTDHYDLGLRPQNSASVLAYLDGMMLQYGAMNDYVVNFETGELVFVMPPAAGKTLAITTIGEGGAGNSLDRAFVVNGGSDYYVGDIITLDGGVPTNGVAANRANVTVTSVKLGNVSVTSGGKGYKPGDVLILGNDIGTAYTSRASLKVENVNSNAEVTSVSIQYPGNYQHIPSTTTWSTTGKGSNVSILTTWAASEVAVTHPGLYTTKPADPFTQFSIVSGYPDKPGSGIEIEARYTSIVDQEVFIGDGVLASFDLKVAPADAAHLMVTVNGAMLPTDNLVVAGNTVTIPAPDYGSFVVFTVFNTDQFSTAVDSMFTAATTPSGQLITTYQLERTAYDTKPDYSTTVVSVDGKILPPPTIDTYVSNGYSRVFKITYQPSDLSLLTVYVDGMPQVSGQDYFVIDEKVYLNFDTPVDSIITIVVVDPDWGYYYKLSGDDITFLDTVNDGFDSSGFDNIFGFDYNDGQDYRTAVIEPGDAISVTNFSQDLSYKFAMEQFQGHPSGLYELAGVPSEESTVTVMINGVLQRMLWDYALVSDTKQGFDTQGYDLSAFDEGLETRWYIKFNENIKQDNQDTIIVQYMRGKTEKPATAFRLLITPQGNTLSQVLSDQSKTFLLDNVYVNSDRIEVADTSVLTPPNVTRAGAVWIGDERIQFSRIIPAPTVQYPNRGFLADLARESNGTNGSPLSDYSTKFYDGTGTRLTFPMPTEMQGHDVTVWVGNAIKVLDVDYRIIGPNVVFKQGKAPGVGYRNVRLSAMTQDSSSTILCYEQGLLVQDGGFRVHIPSGYKWEAAPEGSQFNDTALSKFLLEHHGTRS